MKMELNTDALIEARIPKRFWTLGADTFPGEPKILAQVSKYVKTQLSIRNGAGLRFEGPPQSGKTFLATYALKLLMAHGMSATYFSLEDLADAYFSRLDASTDSFRNRVLQADVACFDNVGMTGNAGFAIALLRAVRLRSDELKPYFICTAFSPLQLLDVYGVRSVSETSSNVAPGDLLSFFEQDLFTVQTSLPKHRVAALREKVKQAYRKD